MEKLCELTTLHHCTTALFLGLGSSGFGPQHVVVRYSIQSGDPQHLFRIDETTGTLFLSGELDRETTPYFLLNVQARAGDPPVYGNTQVKRHSAQLCSSYLSESQAG